MASARARAIVPDTAGRPAVEVVYEEALGRTAASFAAWTVSPSPGRLAELRRQLETLRTAARVLASATPAERRPQA